METDNLILRFVVVSCRLRMRSHPCLDTRYFVTWSIASKLKAFIFVRKSELQIIVILGNFICGLFGEWYLVNLTKLAVCQTSYQITAFCRENKQDSARLCLV